MAPVPGGKWTLTQEGFDSLLAWLDSDRELAGQRYEDIRYRLIKIFAHRGCWEPEELADETINRVARKVEELSKTYAGDPALYFYGVAQKVFQEYVRPRRSPPVVVVTERDVVELEYQCLEHCLEKLESDNRELILGYYEGERLAKINQRRQLARRFGVGTATLRIRAYRIRGMLQLCMNGCLGRKGPDDSAQLNRVN